MVTVASSFSRHLDRFRTQWTALWSLSPGQRSRLVERALALREAKSRVDRNAQVRIVDGVDADLGADPPRGTRALSILDHVVQLWTRSEESEDEMIEEFGRLGFLDVEGDADDDRPQREWIREFFARLAEEGLERGGSTGRPTAD